MMMMKGARALGALAVAVTAFQACRLPPMISDTGYRGTWSRGNDRNVSIVAIKESGGRWYFRWTKHAFDGKHGVVCDWDGRCEERLDGTRVATYTITTRYDAASATLWTDTIEERVAPAPVTYRYTDLLEVVDGGRTLWSYTTDRDGRHFEGVDRPKRSFTKIADSIADPPVVERR